MSVFERLSERTELPACQCGGKMAIERIELIPDSDARIRIYQCPYCHRELCLPESARTNVDASKSRNDDRRAWAEHNRRERTEDRKTGQIIILGSLAALALVFGLIVTFSGNTANVSDRSDPVTTGTAPAR